MPHLTLRVLGGLQVLIDDIPIQSFESDKVRALLAYLAVEADRPHRRETLVGLLWPDCPEETARHNLRQALFNLRLVLGDHTAKPPYLLITRDAIQFNRESDHSLDLALFNEYFDSWKKNRNAENEDRPILISQLEEMVDLYRGEFLQHFFLSDSAEFEDWIVLQRETARQRVMDALTFLANEHELLEDFPTARRFASRQLELDTWREEVHSQIMRVLALDGQRSAALAQYETCRKVLAEELGVEPSPQTRELYEQIRSGTLKPKDKSSTSDAASVPIHNLPVSLTPFFGRERELTDLARLITDPESRCISLIGPGGTGKTRLALQVASNHINEFTHGAAFIPLASVGSVEAVIPAIANGIGFAFYGPTEPKIQLLHHLKGKCILLVLDNLEHLLIKGHIQRTTAELLVEILQQATRVKLLITSREPLHLQGEWLFEVKGLASPKLEETEDLDQYSAFALFVQRARRAHPEFVLNAEDKLGIVRICNLTEGMPLAIELAASWARILSPSEIATEIEHDLDFLNAQMHDLPERHRSMRAVFDHSWQILSQEERQVLGRLSVFRGGFQRKAAQQVAGASLPVLSSLVTRSLLRRTATGRYELHELIRQYAATKLAEDQHELHIAEEQHSLYYLGVLKEKDADLRGSHQKEILTEMTREIDNIRTAWDWSVSHEEFVRLYPVSFTLCYLFALHNWFAEGEAAFWKTAEALRGHLQGTGQRDSLQQTALNAMLAHCGYFRFRLGRGEEAYSILAPSTAFLRSGAEPSAAIYSLWYLGIVCWQLGKFNEARECLQESQALSRQHGESWYQALIGEFLGSLAHGEGADSQAQGYLKEALAIFRRVGDPMMTSHGLSDLGHIMQILGNFDEAEKLLQEGLELAQELDYCRFGVGVALDGLGQVAYARGNYEKASALLSESASLFREIGDTYRLSQVLNYQGLNFLALDDTAQAENAFGAALKIAQEGGLTPNVLEALLGLATVALRHKATEEKLEWVLYVLRHPASAQETRRRATRLYTELESSFPQAQIEMAQQRAVSRNLDDFVRQFLPSA